jgi:hypothetical protein
MRSGVIASALLSGFACLIAGCSSGGSSGGGTPVPVAVVSAATMTFASQTLGTTSSAQSIMLSNTGTANLGVTGITISGDFSQTNNCGSSVAAGLSCTINVTFSPTAIGTRTGTLTITDNSKGSPQTVSLTGTGTSSGSGAITYYVAPNGNDGFSGKLPAPNANNTDGPFATFDHARSVVRSLNKTGITQVTVQFRSGTYFLPAAMQFISADSGSSSLSIVYQNYPSEVPIISGGIQVSGWKNAGGGLWTVSLDPARYAYFEQLFVNGVRRFRPRANSGNYLRNAGAVLVSSQSAACNVQVGTQWECYDRFSYAPGDINPAWSNLNAPYPAGDIEIDVFEKWTMAKMRLQSVDDTNHIAYLTGSTEQGKDHGFLAGHRYLVENVKDALTSPRQWFLDRSTNPWTLSYFPESTEDMTTAVVIAPQLPQLILANGLSYVTFQGLTFSHDNWLVPGAGHASQQGEHNVSAALSCTNCSHVTFDSSVIAHTGGWGLEFVGDDTATSSSNQVSSNMLFDIGTGGVRVGQWPNNADTDTNVPQLNTISNNVVAGFGRLLPAGPGLWIGNAHDNLLTHNEVFDGYNTGIEVCLPTAANCRGTANSQGAFNNTVSFNLVYQLGQGITDDMGCIYFGTEAAPGNQVLNNRCHDVNHATEDADGYGGNGIYLDSTTHGVTVENNLVYRVSQAAYQNTGGPQSFSDLPNTVQNNIFAFSAQGTLTHDLEPPSAALLLHFKNNLVYFDKGNVQRPGGWYCWNMACPSILDFSSNAYWNTNGTLATSAKAFFTTNQNGNLLQNYSFSQWQAIGEDTGSVIANPGFNNPAYPTDDFSLQNLLVANQVGFVEFDTTAPGRTSKAMTPPAVPPGFPTVLLNPATDF